jgi:NADH-ubiquinone oxidoreductase chain 6
MGLDLFFSFPTLKYLLMILAVIAGIFVIATKNAIISVFNLIVLYILVAFYLIYIGITYLGISYIIVYIGAIAILFLFVIMMIDIEVVEKKNNNYLPLLFFLLGGFLFTLKNIFYNIGSIKINSLLYKDQDKLLIKDEKGILFNINPRSLLNSDKFIQNNYNYSDISLFDKLSIDNKLDSFFNNYNLIDNKFDLLSDNFNKSAVLYNNNYEKGTSFINKYNFNSTDFVLNEISSDISDSNYLLIIPE